MWRIPALNISNYRIASKIFSRSFPIRFHVLCSQNLQAHIRSLREYCSSAPISLPAWDGTLQSRAGWPIRTIFHALGDHPTMVTRHWIGIIRGKQVAKAPVWKSNNMFPWDLSIIYECQNCWNWITQMTHSIWCQWNANYSNYRSVVFEHFYSFDLTSHT